MSLKYENLIRNDTGRESSYDVREEHMGDR